MVRFRYGPWDHRYRRFLNVLVGRGLARLEIEGRTVNIGITPEGRRLAESLSESQAFRTTSRRAKLLKTNFNIGGTTLMRFIYATFPEIVSLRFNEEI